METMLEIRVYVVERDSLLHAVGKCKLNGLVTNSSYVAWLLEFETGLPESGYV